MLGSVSGSDYCYHRQSLPILRKEAAFLNPQFYSSDNTCLLSSTATSYSCLDSTEFQRQYSHLLLNHPLKSELVQFIANDFMGIAFKPGVQHEKCIQISKSST